MVPCVYKNNNGNKICWNTLDYDCKPLWVVTVMCFVVYNSSAHELQLDTCLTIPSASSWEYYFVPSIVIIIIIIIIIVSYAKREHVKYIIQNKIHWYNESCFFISITALWYLMFVSVGIFIICLLLFYIGHAAWICIYNFYCCIISSLRRFLSYCLCVCAWSLLPEIKLWTNEWSN